MKKIKHEITILDTLQVCVNNSNKGYCRGMMVGLVSGLMAQGFTYSNAMFELKRICLKTKTSMTWDDITPNLPHGWY